MLLDKARDRKAGYEWGRKLMQEAWDTEAHTLYWIGLVATNAKDPSMRDLDFAQRVLERANELTDWEGEGGEYVLTLAKVKARRGDFARAIELQTKGIELMRKDLRGDSDPSYKEYFEKHLVQLRHYKKGEIYEFPGRP